MPMTRRDFIRQTAAAAAGAVAGISIPGPGAGAADPDAANAQVVEGAVPLLRHRLRRDGGGEGQPRRRHARRRRGRGQPRHQLRQGLLPVQDHVRRGPADDAAAAHEERPVRQGRRVRARLVGPGLRRDGRAVQARAEGQGADRGRHVRLRPVDRLGGLRGAEADEGGLPLQQPRSQRAPLHGVGRGRLHAHLRRRRADGLLRRHRGRRRLRAVGLEHGGDAPGAVDAGDRPAPERQERQGRRAVALRAPLLRAGRHRAHLHAADRPGDPQLHRPPHHQDQPRQPRLRRQAHQLPARQCRHRLRPAARASAAEGGQERRRRGRRQADDLRRVREVRFRPTTSTTPPS